MENSSAPEKRQAAADGFVAISCFAVANGMQTEVLAAFQNRPHQVDDVDGFVRMDVVQPAEDAAEFWLITYWDDEASYRKWHRSHAYSESHAGIPKGLKLVKGRTQIRYFTHVCS